MKYSVGKMEMGHFFVHFSFPISMIPLMLSGQTLFISHQHYNLNNGLHH